jgi:hypothetical protein
MRPKVGFVDNRKARAGDLLQATGEALLATGVIETYFIHQKSLHMLPLNDGERDELLRRADVVVVGVGDCGGCTACAVTDALRCLESGTPAFVVVTDRFVDLAQSTDLAYGLDGLHHLTVEHPIWTRDADWFRSTGSSLAEAVAATLSSLRLCGSAPTT